MPSETGDEDVIGHNTASETEEPHEGTNSRFSAADGTDTSTLGNGTATKSNAADRTAHSLDPSQSGQADNRGRRPARPDEPFEQWEREEMENLLQTVCGHLVVFPTRFLEGEDIANNFLFNADR
jgi:phospholipase D1/2